MGDIDRKKGKGGYYHLLLSPTGKLIETKPLVVTHFPGIVPMMSAGVDEIDSKFIFAFKDLDDFFRNHLKWY